MVESDGPVTTHEMFRRLQPDELLEEKEQAEVLFEQMADLTSKEQVVLARRFGLTGDPVIPAREIAEAVGRTAHAVYAGEHSGLRKLRHPGKARILRETMGDFEYGEELDRESRVRAEKLAAKPFVSARPKPICIRPTVTIPLEPEVIIHLPWPQSNFLEVHGHPLGWAWVVDHVRMLCRVHGLHSLKDVQKVAVEYRPLVNRAVVTFLNPLRRPTLGRIGPDPPRSLDVYQQVVW